MGSKAVQVNELLSTLQSRNEFSGSVLLSKDDEIILHQAYGLENQEHQVVNTINTKFRIGSLTKQFTDNRKANASRRWNIICRQQILIKSAER